MAPTDYARARRALMRRDPVIAALIRQHGDCGLASVARADPFHALLQAIIAQQLSTKAAKTIEGRFSAIFNGNPTPAAVARVSDEQLRAVGVSPQKLRAWCVPQEARSGSPGFKTHNSTRTTTTCL